MKFDSKGHWRPIERNLEKVLWLLKFSNLNSYDNLELCLDCNKFSLKYSQNQLFAANMWLLVNRKMTFLIWNRKETCFGNQDSNKKIICICNIFSKKVCLTDERYLLHKICKRYWFQPVYFNTYNITLKGQSQTKY